MSDHDQYRKEQEAFLDDVDDPDRERTLIETDEFEVDLNEARKNFYQRARKNGMSQAGAKADAYVRTEKLRRQLLERARSMKNQDQP